MTHLEASILLSLLASSHTPRERNRVQGHATLPCVTCPTLLQDSDPVYYNPFDDMHVLSKKVRVVSTREREGSGTSCADCVPLTWML